MRFKGSPRLGLQLLGAIVVTLAGLAPPALAATPDVKARLLAPARLAAGATGTVVVEMTLGPGWHVNSQAPAQSFLIPTHLRLSTSAGTFSPVRYPRHILKRFEFSEEPLAVYEGKVNFEANLTLPDSAAGEIFLDGILRYQACDERTCFPPAKISLVTLVVAEEAKTHEPK
jgi:thiol:disulfide interchange protein DsbD